MPDNENEESIDKLTDVIFFSDHKIPFKLKLACCLSFFTATLSLIKYIIRSKRIYGKEKHIHR